MLFSLKCNGIIQILFRSSLQAQSKEVAKREKAPFFDSCLTSGEKASLTIEAAFVLPMVLFSTLAMLYFIIILMTHVRIQFALQEAARDMAKYAFAYEQLMNLPNEGDTAIKSLEDSELSQVIYQGFSDVYAYSVIQKQLGKTWLDKSLIQGGSNGLILLNSELFTADDMIDITVRYTMNIPYFPNKQYGFLIIQRCKVKAWTGYQMKDEIDIERNENQKGDEELVYIAETGTVYHTNRNCSHLNLSIQETTFLYLDTERNSNGGKYYACDRCIQKNSSIHQGSAVFITKTGDRYHISSNCSGLKRTVKTLSINEVSGMMQCKRCGGVS